MFNGLFNYNIGCEFLMLSKPSTGLNNCSCLTPECDLSTIDSLKLGVSSSLGDGL